MQSRVTLSGFSASSFSKMKRRRIVAEYAILTFTSLLLTALTVQYLCEKLGHSYVEAVDEHIIIRRIRSVEEVVLQTEVEANCTPPAIEQFPKPLFRQEQRQRGAIAIHIIGCLYAFFALAIICDEYFVPSLEILCDVMKIKPDVAGATLMAAGSSAPELATAIIAVFVTKDDIGVGTVVGSAVYNIAFVVAVCGLFAGKVVYLNWWPLVRDSLFYLISILALMTTVYGGFVTWIHSVIFLVIYILYIAFMFVNESLEQWATNLPMFRSLKQNPVCEQAQLVAYKTCGGLPENVLTYSGDTTSSSEEYIVKKDGGSPAETEDSSLEESIFSRPRGSRCRMAIWVLSLPVFVLCYVSVPDCRRASLRKWFMVTFLGSCLWIGGLSYILVWMITIIGHTWNIPDTVMGLTFLAAGVSVPDAIASLIVVREGHGDMAISNAVGSNIFDILLCLGLPWFIQTVIIRPGSVVQVISKGMTYTTICLISTVFFLLISVHINGWKLNKRFGAVMMVWYILFMIAAGLYEGNVFLDVNLPTCPSEY